jgi:hypothetical protein
MEGKLTELYTFLEFKKKRRREQGGLSPLPKLAPWMKGFS